MNSTLQDAAMTVLYVAVAVMGIAVAIAFYALLVSL